MNHLLIRTVTIEYATDGGKSINEIFREVFNKLINLYTKIQKFKKIQI